MPRRRSGANLLPWLSAHPGGKEKRFLQVGNTLLLSPAYQSLTSGAQMLYLCMAMEAGGKQHVLFSRSRAAKYGISKNTYQRQVHELLNHGMIIIDHDGGYYRYMPTTYRLIGLHKPPSCPNN